MSPEDHRNNPFREADKERLRTALNLLDVAYNQYSIALRLLGQCHESPGLPDEGCALAANQEYLKSILMSMERQQEGGSCMLDDPDYPVVSSHLHHLIEMEVEKGSEWEGTIKRRE